MDRYQFRITVNGAGGQIEDIYPIDRWERAAEMLEERSGYAKLERRLITDKGILPLLVDTTGYIKLGDQVICPWEVIAELDYVGA